VPTTYGTGSEGLLSATLMRSLRVCDGTQKEMKGGGMIVEFFGVRRGSHIEETNPSTEGGKRGGQIR